jgi:DNA-binding response OmpR family regulator
MSDAILPNEWQIHGAQRRILLTLLDAPGGAITHQQLLDASATRAQPQSQRVIVRRHIREMREKLDNLGVVINARWGEGYEMPAASREIVRTAIVARLAPPEPVQPFKGRAEG